MSTRLEPFINEQIYHVYNKTIDHRQIFSDDVNCQKLLAVLEYYRSSKATISFSKFSTIEPSIATTYEKKIHLCKYFRVDILTYCLMPTHFHLLIKQKMDRGISRFIADIVNSFTRYFNIKNERKGPLFLSDFKSVMVNNDLQFMHVNRYIHLNPYSSGLINTYSELVNYQWSSLKNYLYGNKDGFINEKDLLLLFNNDRNRYKRFIFSNAEYQKNLETIKYTEKWK